MQVQLISKINNTGLNNLTHFMGELDHNHVTMELSKQQELIPLKS